MIRKLFRLTSSPGHNFQRQTSQQNAGNFVLVGKMRADKRFRVDISNDSHQTRSTERLQCPFTDALFCIHSHIAHFLVLFWVLLFWSFSTLMALSNVTYKYSSVTYQRLSQTMETFSLQRSPSPHGPVSLDHKLVITVGNELTGPCGSATPRHHDRYR